MLDVVVAGVLTEHVSPVVAGQVPVTDGGHEVPDGSPTFNKLVYLGLGPGHSSLLQLVVGLWVVLNSSEREGVADINMDGSGVFCRKHKS